MTKVAVITGGGRSFLNFHAALTYFDTASGMGLAVAQALSQRPDWEVHILDMNSKAGAKVAAELPRAVFHQTNVASYDSLSASVKAAFQSQGRLDFTFANAGVIERKNFYGAQAANVDVPPELDQISIDVDLKGLTATAYLALHYFRQSPHKGEGGTMVLNSSCGGLYASYYSPLYTAAKCKLAKNPFG